jgi:hypothetical protein
VKTKPKPYTTLLRTLRRDQLVAAVEAYAAAHLLPTLGAVAHRLGLRKAHLETLMQSPHALVSSRYADYLAGELGSAILLRPSDIAIDRCYWTTRRCDLAGELRTLEHQISRLRARRNDLAQVQAQQIEARAQRLRGQIRLADKALARLEQRV